MNYYASEISTALSKVNSLQAVELSCHQTCKSVDRFFKSSPVVISSLQIVSSTVFRIRVSLQRLSWFITQWCRTDSSRYSQRLLLSGDVHQNPVPATKYPCSVVGWAICAIVVLVGFIRSVLVFKTQRSTVELRTLAVPHPLHQYRNRFHHQLQLKLPMGIPSPFYNSMQMASATNRLN